MDQQIAAVKAALAAIESAIAQTEGALHTASTPQDVFALTAALVDLRAERARLQLQLANLEAAAVVVEPLGGAAAIGAPARASRGIAPGRKAQMKTLEKQLTTAVTDRSVAVATLAFATDVIDKARSVRMIGDDVEPATISRPAGKRSSGTRSAATRSRKRSR
jgi:hypothetical protein